jgi:hypothetical protein
MLVSIWTGSTGLGPVVHSFGIREAFKYLGEEFDQASLVLKFESERMVGECELVVKLRIDCHTSAIHASAILFENVALLQYSFCRLTVAFEYGEV